MNKNSKNLSAPVTNIPELNLSSETENKDEKTTLEISLHEYEGLLKTLKNEIRDVVEDVLSVRTMEFMVETAIGFRILKCSQIIYFKYLKQKKQWEGVLADNTAFFLKRKTNADDILSFSSSFARINQQQIINLEYLASIEGKKCILDGAFHPDTELIISRNYLKELQDKFRQI